MAPSSLETNLGVEDARVLALQENVSLQWFFSLGEYLKCIFCAFFLLFLMVCLVCQRNTSVSTICRKTRRSHDKWRQSLARLWWTPSMVSCFMNRLKHVWLNCDTVEDWLSARCLDELGWTQSNWLHSIYDKTIIMSFWYWGYFKTISKWCQAHMLSVYEMLNPMSRRSERSNW